MSESEAMSYIEPLPDGSVIPNSMSEMDSHALAISMATDYVTKLDRSRLGSFAVSDDRLVKSVVNFLIWGGTDVRPLSIMEKLSGVEDKSDSKASGEAYFWRKMFLDSEFVNSEYSHDVFTYKRYNSWDDVANFLLRVYNNPTHLHYYEAGIWDDVEIANALHSDVDPSLLRSILYLG